ncbi:AI-2E family transporter [Flammeovirgaceae bacterium SG7u.111]|nr:AI-2E family transporter [Flammeovirgaceae bacterium SG7u.132]WPO34085.1 AI-2E family transporter [Flammeovirgaceae bacterium SG7u.111]
MENNQKLTQFTQNTVEVVIRLGFLFLLIAWCLGILLPFSGVIVWAVILAIASAPLYDFLNKRLGNKPKRAATVYIIIGLSIIMLPSWLFLESLISGVHELKTNLDNGTLAVPPPNESVAEWPLIGDELYASWKQASENLESIVLKYQEQVTTVAASVLQGAVSMGGSVFQFILATIISGVLLATQGTDEFSRKFFRKLVGERGHDFADMSIKTVRNVTKGVLGVAVIQAFLIGLGFLLAGIPYAGIWALLVLILAILQLPALVVVLPVIVYLFSIYGPIPASLWTLYLLVAGASDNFLKPMLLGKGAPVPMIVIFLGVVGGFLLSGFIGLFTGAIVLSIGFKLFVAWLNTEDKPLEEAVRPVPED